MATSMKTIAIRGVQVRLTVVENGGEKKLYVAAKVPETFAINHLDFGSESEIEVNENH